MDTTETAYHLWRRYYESFDIDYEVAPFLKAQQGRGWLRKARIALFRTASHVSQRLNTSKAAYAKLEQSELRGAISLNTLEKAAAALDCELVYALRPKARIPFSRIIWDKLVEEATSAPRVRLCRLETKHYVLSSVAAQFMRRPDFRRRQDWSER